MFMGLPSSHVLFSSKDERNSLTIRNTFIRMFIIFRERYDIFLFISFCTLIPIIGIHSIMFHMFYNVVLEPYKEIETFQKQDGGILPLFDRDDNYDDYYYYDDEDEDEGDDGSFGDDSGGGWRRLEQEEDQIPLISSEVLEQLDQQSSAPFDNNSNNNSSDGLLQQQQQQQDQEVQISQPPPPPPPLSSNIEEIEQAYDAGVGVGVGVDQQHPQEDEPRVDDYYDDEGGINEEAVEEDSENMNTIDVIENNNNEESINGGGEGGTSYGDIYNSGYNNDNNGDEEDEYTVGDAYGDGDQKPPADYYYPGDNKNEEDQDSNNNYIEDSESYTTYGEGYNGGGDSDDGDADAVDNDVVKLSPIERLYLLLGLTIMNGMKMGSTMFLGSLLITFINMIANAIIIRIVTEMYCQRSISIPTLDDILNNKRVILSTLFDLFCTNVLSMITLFITFIALYFVVLIPHKVFETGILTFSTICICITLYIYTSIPFHFINQVVVIEQYSSISINPINTFRKCWYLVKSYRLYIFGIRFTYYTMLFMMQFIIILMFGGIRNKHPILGSLIMNIQTLILLPLGSILHTVIYLNLRIHKEGLTYETLCSELDKQGQRRGGDHSVIPSCDISVASSVEIVMESDNSHHPQHHHKRDVVDDAIESFGLKSDMDNNSGTDDDSSNQATIGGGLDGQLSYTEGSGLKYNDTTTPNIV